MSEFIVTFGQGQFGGALKDSFILFKNGTDLQARRWMAKHFAGRWSGIYAGTHAATYVEAYQPVKLAEVTFVEPSDDEHAADRYSETTGRRLLEA